ncbi:hypothetical protein F164LOC_10150 [Pectobacterium carotovorum]|nr:hypothetical protein F164LOC_10150 [Pectobacterium carotovorum]
MREIIVDNFAGGGGASTGIEMAIGRSVDIAINHDPNAIAMHTTNHPDTLHYCESVFDIDPVTATAGRPVGLAWFSPDCRHFSKAKGSKPVKKEIRGLAWIVLRWALAVRPRVMMLENVEEFKTWGPLLTNDDGTQQPDPARAENTLKRIARGLERFVINNPNPFIVKCNHTSTKTRYDCFRGQSLNEPLQTITKTHGYAVVAPYIARIGQTGFGGDRMAYDAETPLTTVTSKNEHLLVAPVIARQFGNSVGHAADEPNGTITAGGGGKSQLVSAFLAKHFGGNYTGPGANLDEPAHTVTAVDHHALVTSNLIKMRGTNTGQPTDTPLQTVTAGGNHFGEVRAFLLKYYGNEKEGVSLNDPLHTVTTNDRFGLVTVEGVDYQIVDIGMRMLQPHELYAAQGFPEWYIIDQDFRGVKYAKDKQVARCGNAVPPPFAEALVRANLPDMCVKKQQAA